MQYSVYSDAWKFTYSKQTRICAVLFQNEFAIFHDPPGSQLQPMSVKILLAFEKMAVQHKLYGSHSRDSFDYPLAVLEAALISSQCI